MFVGWQVAKVVGATLSEGVGVYFGNYSSSLQTILSVLLMLG